MPEPDPWRIAASLVTAASLDEQLNLLLEAAPGVGGADTATAYLEDPDTGELRVIARYGYTPVRDTRPRARGMTRRILDTGETITVQDTAADPSVNPVVLQAGIRSIIGLPIITRRAGQPRPTGVLYVNATRPNAFTPEAIASLQGLAGLAGVAIENTLLLEDQRATARRLEDALLLRDQFVSLASHELKGPLTPLKGYAQAIARRLDRAAAAGAPLDEAWLRRTLSIMVGQIDRLDRLVTDLLDVSRVRAGQFTVELEPLDLVALAHETFDRFRDTITADAATESDAGRHTFLWRPEAQSLPGTWDRNRLDQLITNLLGNAVKYSPNGGEIELRLAPASPQDLTHLPNRAAPSNAASPADQPPNPKSKIANPKSDWVSLSVRDQGIGLPGTDDSDPARARLFEAFTRGEGPTVTETSGFGLGLFICAEVVRRHGGAIWAESPGPDQGTTFHVLLPTTPPAGA